MNQNLKVVHIDVDKLTPYDRNSKIHTPAQVRHIASSIEQFGFNDPLGVWGEDNIILEGNGRLEALKLLGFTSVPCLRLDHLTDDERRAYVIAHNHINQQTGFDEKVLLDELRALQGSVDMAAIGVHQDEYLTKLKSLDTKELAPYKQVHYMVSMSVDIHDRVADIIARLRAIEGVNVDSTLN